MVKWMDETVTLKYRECRRQSGCVGCGHLRGVDPLFPVTRVKIMMKNDTKYFYVFGEKMKSLNLVALDFSHQAMSTAKSSSGRGME